MAGARELGRLTDAEYADLNDRVDRFHTAWKADGAAAIDPFLPSPGARHRKAVLVELVKTEMELRAKAGLAIDLERYLTRFPADLPPAEVPVSLLVAEYTLRHRHLDRPTVEQYRTRFPTQFDEFARLARPPVDRSIGTDASMSQATPASDEVEPTKATGPTPSGPTAPVPTGFLPSDLKYKLIRRIGRGAFGEVYAAEAPGGFRVAVKRILREVDHPAIRAELEALEALKTMNHPFLLQTHAYWVFEDRLVIVMELADGSLDDWIKHHTGRGLPGVPPGQLVPFFEQAGAALDYLHGQNVTHRDIKPPNLLHLKGYAKVADFGLAREQEKSLETVAAEVGTPMFMAPEVWAQKVSLHSDQYSLAAAYVQARLGRPLFGPVKLSLQQAMYKHLHDPPDLGTLPPAEKAVLARALAKKPGDRFPSCAAFGQALRDAVMPAPAGAGTSRRGLVLAAAGVLASGVGVGLWEWLRPKPEVVVVPPPVEPPPVPPPPLPPAPWCPRGWDVDKAAKVVESGGRRLAARLTRELVPGEVLAAVLIAPEKPDHPPAFYLLENKVTNRVFAAAWELAEADEKSTLRRLLDKPPTGTEGFFPGDWKDGAPDADGKPLKAVGDQAGVPVVAVTVPEAIVAAEALGGVLPTYAQWRRAVETAGPWPPGPQESRGEDLTQRPLALGLAAGPWPVATETKDRINGVHQLTSNGFEWTRTAVEDATKPVTLADLPLVTFTIRKAGQNWTTPQVLTPDRIPNLNRLEDWLATKVEYNSFRVALLPE